MDVHNRLTIKRMIGSIFDKFNLKKYTQRPCLRIRLDSES